MSLVFLSLALTLAGCDKMLPMAPSDWATGIIIYEHANYLGQSALVDKDISSLEDYKGPCSETSTGANGTSDTSYFWKNCISSVRVAAGWKAIVYKDKNFKGASYEVLSDVSNLQLVPGDCDHGGFNDCIESIRVSRQ